MHPAAVPSEPSRRTSWLPTVEEAYRRMLVLIDRAQDSIRFETYIWRADAIGNQFRTALVAAARRGVHVQVLVDGFGSNSLPGHYWAALEKAGGVARIFNPLSWRHFGIRNHRKLLLLDDRLAVVGGFNIATEYDGDGVTRGWRDFGLELHHPLAVRQLAESFDGLFRDHQLRRWLLRPFRKRALNWPRFFRQPGPVLFSGPRFVRRQFRFHLLHALRDAQNVRIVSAYFLPSFRLRRALARVARRGGTVELILAGKTDVSIAQTAARSIYGPLLKAGVRIWEYQPQVLHAKLALVDQTVFAGTSNLDARSLGINYELMVRLADAPLAAEARARFDADLIHSKAITLRDWQKSRTWLTRLRGTWARFLLTKVDPWLARRQLRDIS